MELELGLALPDPGPKAAGELGFLRLDGKKRGFGDAFGAGKATLPLFVGDDDDEDDGGHGDGDGSGAAHRETSNKRKRLVGWPPVKRARRLRVREGEDGGRGHREESGRVAPRLLRRAGPHVPATR